MRAYVATAEHAQLICAFDKSASKALKKVAKKIDEMQKGDEYLMLSSVNVGYDDDFYHVTATVTSVGF